jgi:hypothetical protein
MVLVGLLRWHACILRELPSGELYIGVIDLYQLDLLCFYNHYKNSLKQLLNLYLYSCVVNNIQRP